MSREKKIEEMAKILCGMKKGCDECAWDKVHCDERNDAEEIYNAGYRKESEVAREIFEEMIELLSMRMGIKEVIAELKKKYTEGRHD